MSINAADTAWVLMSGALVLLMTPGLAIFYGGMVRAKSALNMIMMSFSAIGIVTMLWVLAGYSLAFGSGSAFIGDLSMAGLQNLFDDSVGVTGHKIPVLAFAMFQLTFAIITAALLSGAIADRAKFGGWLVFVSVWSLVVYVPLAHMAFATNDGQGGYFVDHLGALDFAGGTAVEINSGASALALALVLGRRLGFRKDPMRPHNLPLVLLGAGLLWFGWFGFNAGSALTSGALASTAMINTQIATATAAMGWLLVEQRRDGRPTTLGVASGAIAGAVGITPACGFVTPLGAMLIGLAAGIICSLAVGMKFRFGYDDSLDVVGVHGVGGLVGMIGIGLLASSAANELGANGLFYGGGVAQLQRQLMASIVTGLFAFVATYLIAMAVERTVGFRADRDDELAGLDTTLHAETAYDFVGTIGSGAHSIGSHRPREVS